MGELGSTTKVLELVPAVACRRLGLDPSMAVTDGGGGYRTSRGCERWRGQRPSTSRLARLLPQSLNTCPLHAGGRAKNNMGRTAMWDQIYNPLGNTALSTVAAAVP